MRTDTTVTRRERATAVGALLVVWAAFVFPAFAGQVRFPVDFAGPEDPAAPARPPANPEQGDAYYAMYPWHEYLGARLAAGQAPLWDPHRFAGTPFAADVAVGAWYPPNLLYAVADPLRVFTVVSVASSLAALLVTYWFLRVLRLHPYAAALGAVTFAFSAFLVKWATNETVTASAVWMALPLGGLEVARQGRPLRGTVIAAAGLALVTLGGHAQVALYVWAAAGAWAAWGLAAPRLRRRLEARAGPRGPVAARAAGGAAVGAVRRLALDALPAVVAVALALGLAAVQVLPAGELSAEIVRQATTWEDARATFLPPAHLPTLVVPDYLGSPADGNWDGPGVNYTETALWAGVVTLPLAAAGLFSRRRRAAVFFAAMVAAGLLAVLGTPLYRLVLALPGFDRTLFATRFVLYVDFGLACLAALGLDHLLGDRAAARRLLPVVAVSSAAVLVAVAWLALARPATPLPPSYVLGRGLRAAAFAAAGGAALVALARAPRGAGRAALVVVALSAGDLWATGHRFNPFHEHRPVYRDQPATDALAAAPGARPRFAEIGDAFALPPNASLVHRLYGIGGYDALIPRNMVELVAVAEDQRARAARNLLGPFRPSTAASPVFDLLGVTHLVGGAAAEAGGRPVVGGRLPVYERPGAFPPAFLASCWELVADGGALGRLAAMAPGELRGTALVTASAPARRALGGLGPPGPGSCGPAGEATVERYEPERVSVAARARGPAVLVVSDTWFPGWQATVDGEAAPVLEVDHALRGVAVPAGEHRVELRFRPASFRAGAALSVATALAVGVAAAGVAAARRRAGRRGTTRAPAPPGRPPGRPCGPAPRTGRPPGG
ncbi:MAG TPA: YfhO family protein [Acidimicrobiales bacterium]|nr:YfhO family protein [Acidimicrobiales bacterium]